LCREALCPAVVQGGGWGMSRFWPHRSLRQESPAGREHPPVEVTDMRVLRRDRLGGLIHEYAKVA
jgi:hypothetical protein